MPIKARAQAGSPELLPWPTEGDNFRLKQRPALTTPRAFSFLTLDQLLPLSTTLPLTTSTVMRSLRLPHCARMPRSTSRVYHQH
jgi:hypothetical protein